MSAREDYPRLIEWASIADNPRAIEQLHQALNEIDRLRRWKAEASEVLARWDLVAERFDLSGHLGQFTADAVGAEIDHMRASMTTEPGVGVEP